jgi:hypothetical protein
VDASRNTAVVVAKTPAELQKITDGLETQIRQK